MEEEVGSSKTNSKIHNARGRNSTNNERHHLQNDLEIDIEGDSEGVEITENDHHLENFGMVAIPNGDWDHAARTLGKTESNSYSKNSILEFLPHIRSPLYNEEPIISEANALPEWQTERSKDNLEIIPEEDYYHYSQQLNSRIFSSEHGKRNEEYSGAVGKRRRILEEKEYGTESPREEENIEAREVEAEEGEDIANEQEFQEKGDWNDKEPIAGISNNGKSHGKAKKQKKKSGKPSSTSSQHLPSHGSPWSEEEQRLFEEGLSIYGRGNWKSISLHVKTRNALQVKNHARQHFRKVPVLPNSPLMEKKPPVRVNRPSKPKKVNLQESVVHIKKEEVSEDVEIDIGEDSPHETPTSIAITPPATSPIYRANSPIPSSHTPNGRHRNGIPITIEHHPEIGVNFSEIRRLTLKTEDTVPPDQNSANSNGNATSEKQNSSESENEDSELRPNVYIEPPTSERILGRSEIVPIEQEFCPEFFCGNAVKTPERYLKIRNYIVDQWTKSKPSYLSKTSVRTGLKDCGDVNAIGRVHEFLELYGTINFGSNKPLRFRRRAQRAGPSTYSHIDDGDKSKLQTTEEIVNGRRKRKVRLSSGEWVSEEEYKRLHHSTTLHSNGDGDEIKKPKHHHRHERLAYDPFRLIQTRNFNEISPPFRLHISSNAMLMIDLHAHLVKTEVIGLLGGFYDEAKQELRVEISLPCDSVSTGIQCEMDPLSQVKARDLLDSMNMQLVGWYHSHPTFPPNPSLRDIENQSNYQSLFTTKAGIEPFIGVIVTPYQEEYPMDYSQFSFVHIGKSTAIEDNFEYRIPFELPHEIRKDSLLEDFAKQAGELVLRHSGDKMFVDFASVFRQDAGKTTTYFEKLMTALSNHMFLSEEMRRHIFNSLHELLQQNHNNENVIPLKS